MDFKSETPRERCCDITRTVRAAAVLFLAGFVTPGFMIASGLNGNLTLTDMGAGTIAVNGTDIDFDYSGGVNSTSPPTATSGSTVDGNGDSALFTLTNASTLSFAPIIGSTVTVADLNSTSEPTGAPVSLTFITFTAEPTWSITLTELLPGVEGSAGCFDPSGVECTPAGSPFNLINEGGDQVSVSFAFSGTASDGTNISAVGGTFSTTFSGTTYQQILTDLNAGDAIVSSAQATIIVATAPEPASASLLLLGGAFLSISAIYRRRRQNCQCRNSSGHD
jgi:hypothetical protein